MSVDIGAELEPIPAKLEKPKINLHYVSQYSLQLASAVHASGGIAAA